LDTPFLQPNLEALASAQPAFAAPHPTGKVLLDQGQWRLVTGGRAVAIHSRDPQRQADREAEAVLGAQPEPQLIAVVGLGLGFLLDALEHRGWKGRILALEPEPDTVQPLLARRDWRAWIGEGRLRLLVGSEYPGASECRTLFADGSTDPVVIVNPVLARLDPRAEDGARAVVRRLRSDARSNAEARKKHGARYLLNTLSNLQALATEGDVAALNGAFQGVPAIVVGAGPSLDHALCDLRQAQHQAIIITVDTALRPLLSAGVEPHFVVALDPGETNARHLWDLPPCPETFLVSEASLTPIGLEHFRGRTFLFSVSDHQPWPWLASHGQSRGRLRAWGSVLTSAFDLALRLGCGPVIFAGADLAFTGDRPYGRGVAYEEDWRRLADWGVPLESHWRDVIDSWPRLEEPDINGAPTRTAAHLVTFRNWLVEQIGHEKGRTFINTTGAGILRGPHVVQRPLPDVMASFERRHPRLRSLVRHRHRSAPGRPLLCAAKALLDDVKEISAPSPTADALLRTWEGFADGLSRDRIVETLRGALDDSPRPEPDMTDAVERGLQPARSSSKAEVSLDAEWMTPLAASLPLVWFEVPPVRMEAIAPHVRMFRCRTTAGRLFACAIRMPSPAVVEDGQPLRLGTSLDTLAAGEYFIWRDEVRFRSTDDSDPRENGRAYAVLMPQCVASLEGRPLSEILDDGL